MAIILKSLVMEQRPYRILKKAESRQCDMGWSGMRKLKNTFSLFLIEQQSTVVEIMINRLQKRLTS